MKIVRIFIGLISFNCYAQITPDTAQVSLDMLASPASSAANLIGISPKEIQKPTDFKGFVISLQNATNGFSSIPNSFAVDFDLSYFKPRKLKDFDKPNLAFSFAATNINRKAEKQDTLKLAVALKLSLLKGKMKNNPLARINALSDLIFSDYLKEMLVLDSLIDANVEVESLKAERNQLAKMEVRNEVEELRLIEIGDRINFLADSLRAPYITRLRERREGEIKALLDEANNVKFERWGHKLDLAGGLVGYFPDEVFGNSKNVNKKWGVWGTYEFQPLKENYSLLSIIRYQYNPDKIFSLDKTPRMDDQVVNALDFGGSVEYRINKLTLSGEAIHRWASVSHNNLKSAPSSWRAVFNLNYEIDKNTAITFSFGRNFDRVTKYDGNVIAALNFIKGFGKRKLLY